jgi:mannan endo-1,4-beta-mannosidase
MAKQSKLAGKRLIDYLDFHGFPEVWGTDAKGNKVNVLGDFAYDPVLTPKQFDAMRIFWDPTFTSPDSWCANGDNKPYLWDPWVGILPKLHKIVDANFPGTKLSMTEYYPASKSYYHGGLLQAVNLGLFMREGLDMACDWDGAHPGNYVFMAHQLYSNYDGKGAKVGGNYVDATSSSADLYAFGAKDARKTFLVLVNKNHDADIDAAVTLPAAATVYHTYTLSESTGKRLYDSGAVAATGAQLKIGVPAFSAVLVVAQ